MSESLADIIVNAWAEVAADNAKRERDQITTLHNLRRTRNGRWIDSGPRPPHGWEMRLLLSQFSSGRAGQGGS